MDPTSLPVKSLHGKSYRRLPEKFREPDPDLNLRISRPFKEVAIGCLEVPSHSSHKPEQLSISVQAKGEQMAKYLSPLNPKQKFLFPAGHHSEQICHCSIWRHPWLLLLNGEEILNAWVLLGMYMWKVWVLHKWCYEHGNPSQTVIPSWVHMARFLFVNG